MNGSPNDLMPQGEGSAPLFIARWDRRAPQDQTDLTKSQDDSSEMAEEASRRGAGPTWRPLASGFFRCLAESSHIPFMIFFVADKFCGKYALESLFSSFLEIDPRKYRICKTRGNCQFKP